MWPKSTTSDLPSSHDIKVYLHNAFVKHINELKDEITVSNFIVSNLLKILICTCLSRRLQGKYQLLKMDGRQILRRWDL
jgi:hypothetical protein